MIVILICIGAAILCFAAAHLSEIHRNLPPRKAASLQGKRILVAGFKRHFETIDEWSETQKNTPGRALAIERTENKDE